MKKFQDIFKKNITREIIQNTLKNEAAVMRNWEAEEIGTRNGMDFIGRKGHTEILKGYAKSLLLLGYVIFWLTLQTILTHLKRRKQEILTEMDEKHTIYLDSSDSF